MLFRSYKCLTWASSRPFFKSMREAERVLINRVKISRGLIVVQTNTSVFETDKYKRFREGGT